jgi:hypothetical protein
MLNKYYDDGDELKKELNNNIDTKKILEEIDKDQNANIEQLQIHILKNKNESYSKWLEQYNIIHKLIKEIAELEVSKNITQYYTDNIPNPVIEVDEFFYILESYYQKILDLFKKNNTILFKKNNTILFKDKDKIERMWLLFNPNLKIKVKNNTYINLIENNFSKYIKQFKINDKNYIFTKLILTYDLNCTYNYVICRTNNKLDLSNLKLNWPDIKLNNKIIFEYKVIDDKKIDDIKKIHSCFISCENIVTDKRRTREEQENNKNIEKVPMLQFK